jgi:hypothetical protein
MQTAIEDCDNCGAKIGRLEPAHAWKNHVVCARCMEKLSGPATSSQKVSARKKYIDYLRWPRLVILLVAMAFSLLPAFGDRQSKPDYTTAYLFWAAWIALGLVAIVQKANWKRKIAEG